MPHIEIVAVNVGQPQVLGRKEARPVYSSIRKSPVVGPEILLTYTNLSGDQQVDTKPKADGRQLHGGNEMAVYAYPAEHLPIWSSWLKRNIGPGMLGENLTTLGILESEVYIGDHWSWGNALLEVSKPRQPCYKLNMLMGVPMTDAMRSNGLCGWYLRVLTPAFVPASRPIKVVRQSKDNPTVAEAFAEKSKKAEK